MDGVHDLGGKQGFGPVDVIGGDVIFHHDWERRMWALARAGILRDITIDWFRHSVERMVPADYLSYAYLQKWATTYLMIWIDQGLVTIDEVRAGHADNRADPAPAIPLADLLERQRGTDFSFERPAAQPPAHTVGDRVHTRHHTTAPHSRLPAYARDRTGIVVAHHGAHLLPDKGALGVHEAEHLYTVEFTAPELWDSAADPRDTVTLDLWESYFV